MWVGVKQKWVPPQFWFDNGMDDKPNPVQVRKVTVHSEPEWTVKARVELGGKKVRVIKAMTKVHNEFAVLVAEEAERRRQKLLDSSWMQWEPHILWTRLVAARDEAPGRKAELDSKKTHMQLVVVAIEWGLCEEAQEKWLESQRRPPPPRDDVATTIRGPGDVGGGGHAGPDALAEHSVTGMLLPNFEAAHLRSDLDNWRRFYRACCEGDVDTIRSLVKDRRGVLQLFAADHVDSNGRTVVHCACAHADLPTVRLLVKERSNLEFKFTGARISNWMDQPDENGWTPFFFACWWGNYLVAEFLIRAGANVSHVSRAGFTALELAVRAGNRQKLIAHLASTDLVPDDPWIILHNRNRARASASKRQQLEQASIGPYSTGSSAMLPPLLAS